MTDTVVKHLTKEEATKLFSKLFYGEHHLPGKVKEHGYGWCVNFGNDFSTFDYNTMTRFVIMCHDECIRGSVVPSGPGMLKLCLWKRYGRDGQMVDRHPTMEMAIEKFRSE